MAATSLILIALATCGTEPKTEQLAKVRAELKSSSVEVRRMAIKDLIHSDLSKHLAKEMFECLKDADGDVRSTACSAIGNLGAKAAAAIPALIAQMEKDSVKEARETAARALGRIGNALPTNRIAVKPLTKTAAEDADLVTRAVALGALAMMDEDVSGQVTALRRYLHNKDALVRMKAAHALGMIGLPAKAASAEIVAVLEKEIDEHRRGYVARALGNVGDPAALPALQAALKKETYDGAKGEMRGAIQKLGGKP